MYQRLSPVHGRVDRRPATGLSSSNASVWRPDTPLPLEPCAREVVFNPILCDCRSPTLAQLEES